MLPTAGDLMEKHVISVGADTPLLDVHRLFVEEEIHGAPVVDEEGALVGVISASDLLWAVEEEHEALRPRPDYFERLCIHRVFVAEHGDVLGVVSAFDLIRLLEDSKEP